MAEIQEQIVREAPEIEAYKLGLLESAKALSDQPITLPVQQVAGISGLQQAAFDTAQAGIGAYEPYLTEAGFTMGDAYAPISGSLDAATGYIAPGVSTGQGLVASGVSTGQGLVGSGVSTGQGLLASGAGALTPEMISGYMNPYQQAVFDEINRSYNIQQAQLGQQAAGAGAFGGSRSAVMESELGRNRASALAQAQAANFLQAQQAAQNEMLRRQQAGQQIGSLGIQGGQQIGSLGIQGGQQIGSLGLQAGQTLGTMGLQTGEALGTLGLRQAALGETAQNLGLREQEALYTMGARQQAQQQAILEAQRQSELAQLYEPYQRMSFLSDIYKGAPSTQQTIATATSPAVSPAQQYLGLGIAGLAAAGGAAKSGLFG